MAPLHLTLSFTVICNITATHLSLQESSLRTQWPTPHFWDNLMLFHLSVCSHSLPGLVSPSALGISPVLQAQVTPQFLHEAFLALIPAPPEALCTLRVVVAILSVVVVLTQAWPQEGRGCASFFFASPELQAFTLLSVPLQEAYSLALHLGDGDNKHLVLPGKNYTCVHMSQGQGHILQ